MHTTISYCQDGIVMLHNVTGTPWYITIPLVAFTVNLIRLPASLQGRKMLQRKADLTPLVLAWRERHVREIKRQRAKQRLSYEQFLQQVQSKTKETMKRLQKDHGLQEWKMWGLNLAVFPLWLTVIEAIRRMSGGPIGLLGTLSQLWSGKRADGIESPVMSRPSPGEESLWGPESVHQSEMRAPTPVKESPWGSESTLRDTTAAPPASEATVPADTNIITPEILGYEPSMTTGGCLWFPDLTSADPYTILPYMLSAMLFVNLLPRNMAQMKQIMNMEQSPEVMANPWPFRIRRALMFLALAVGPLTANLPAAVHVYWISTSGFNYLQGKVAERMLPIKSVAVKPCRERSRSMQPPPPTVKPPPPPTIMSKRIGGRKL